MVNFPVFRPQRYPSVGLARSQRQQACRLWLRTKCGRGCAMTHTTNSRTHCADLLIACDLDSPSFSLQAGIQADCERCGALHLVVGSTGSPAAPRMTGPKKALQRQLANQDFFFTFGCGKSDLGRARIALSPINFPPKAPSHRGQCRKNGNLDICRKLILAAVK